MCSYNNKYLITVVVKKIPVDDADQFRFLGNCPPTPPLSKRKRYFSLRAKCWFRGGVGGRFLIMQG